MSEITIIDEFAVVSEEEWREIGKPMPLPNFFTVFKSEAQVPDVRG